MVGVPNGPRTLRPPKPFPSEPGAPNPGSPAVCMPKADGPRDVPKLLSLPLAASIPSPLFWANAAAWRSPISAFNVARLKGPSVRWTFKLKPSLISEFPPAFERSFSDEDTVPSRKSFYLRKRQSASRWSALAESHTSWNRNLSRWSRWGAVEVKIARISLAFLEILLDDSMKLHSRNCNFPWLGYTDTVVVNPRGGGLHGR